MTRSIVPSWFDPDDERLARVAWSRLVEPGDLKAGEAAAERGVVAALKAVLENEPGIPAAWRLRLANCDPVRDLRMFARLGGQVVIPGDPQWPIGLDDLGPAAPWCLWVRGNADLAELGRRSVAVVGARAATEYGRELATSLAFGLAEAGFTTVSGGAYGIDAAAHRGALTAQGPTVAVLACGADRAYPSGNEALLHQIAATGAVVSELAPGSSPTKWRFLERNRLIAAMTSTTVVVEAAWRSGAQNTARHALGLGRAVGACPGPVTSAASAGCHRLLREGAACITDVGELLELASPIGTYLEPGGPATEQNSVLDQLDPVQARLLEALPVRRPAGLDSLSALSGVSVKHALAALGALECKELAEGSATGWRLTGSARTLLSGRAGRTSTSERRSVVSGGA